VRAGVCVWKIGRCMRCARWSLTSEICAAGRLGLDMSMEIAQDSKKAFFVRHSMSLDQRAATAQKCRVRLLDLNEEDKEGKKSR